MARLPHARMRACPSAPSSNAGPRGSGQWPSPSTGQDGAAARRPPSLPWRRSSRIGSGTSPSRASPGCRASSPPPVPLEFGQTRRQDPHELRRRLRSDLGSSVRQVVLHGRVRQAQAVGGCLLRPGDQDRGHDHDLTVCRTRDRKGVGDGAIPDGTVARAASTTRSLGPHASRLAAASHSSRLSIGTL